MAAKDIEVKSTIESQTLIQLIAAGKTDEALALIQSKTVDLNAVQRTGDRDDTALLLAVEDNHVQIVDALIAGGVDVNALCTGVVALEMGCVYMLSPDTPEAFLPNIYQILVSLLKTPNIEQSLTHMKREPVTSHINLLEKIIALSYPPTLADFQALNRDEREKREPKGLYFSDKVQSTAPSSQGTFLFNLRNDVGQELDLLGTVHDLPFDKLPKALQERCRKKAALAKEMLPSSENMLNIFLGIVTKFQGLTLVNEYGRLKSETRSKIEAILDQNPYGKIILGKGLQSYKPWVILIMLSYLESGSQARAQLEGMDEALRLFFLDNKKQVWGLETYADRVEANNLPQLTFAECEKKINALLDSQNEKEEKEIIEAYLAGDIQRVFALDKKAEEDAYMIARNKNWVPKIVEYLKKNSGQLLVTVGVSHLWGNTGLLSLLAKEGFKITRCYANGSFAAYDVNVDFPAKSASTASATKKQKKQKKKKKHRK